MRGGQDDAAAPAQQLRRGQGRSFHHGGGDGGVVEQPGATAPGSAGLRSPGGRAPAGSRAMHCGRSVWWAGAPAGAEWGGECGRQAGQAASHAAGFQGCSFFQRAGAHRASTWRRFGPRRASAVTGGRRRRHAKEAGLDGFTARDATPGAFEPMHRDPERGRIMAAASASSNKASCQQLALLGRETKARRLAPKRRSCARWCRAAAVGLTRRPMKTGRCGSGRPSSAASLAKRRGKKLLAGSTSWNAAQFSR